MKRVAAGLLLALVAALALACDVIPARHREPAPAPSTQVRLSTTIGGLQPWEQPLTVSVVDGTLVDIVVTGPEGTVPGTLAESAWTSRGELWPATRYTATVTTRRSDGRRDVVRRVVTTTDAPRLRPVMSPGDGDTVGVGMPVRVQFNHPVPVAMQPAVARRLVVTATPATTGGWRWFSSTELHWRPSEFWRARTGVRVSLDLTGLRIGPNLWGDPPHTTTWRVGDAHVSTVDIAMHRMTVTSNGRVMRVAPMSAGRNEYPTHAGTHIALEKVADIVMDSATVGIPRNSPDGYYEHVQWNVRIAYSGEFVHSAPWSVSQQGSANVSHGCVNLAPEAAEWFYRFTLRGDVVRVINGGAPPNLGDPGTFDWNRPASDWRS